MTVKRNILTKRNTYVVTVGSVIDSQKQTSSNTNAAENYNTLNVHTKLAWQITSMATPVINLRSQLVHVWMFPYTHTNLYDKMLTYRGIIRIIV